MYNYLNVCFYFAILYIANYNHLYLVCEGNKSILNFEFLNLYSAEMQRRKSSPSAGRLTARSIYGTRQRIWPICINILYMLG